MLGIAERYGVAGQCTGYVQLGLGIAVRSAGVVQCTARFIDSRDSCEAQGFQHGFMGSARAMWCTVRAGGCGEACGAYGSVLSGWW